MCLDPKTIIQLQLGLFGNYQLNIEVSDSNYQWTEFRELDESGGIEDYCTSDGNIDPNIVEEEPVELWNDRKQNIVLDSENDQHNIGKQQLTDHLWIVDQSNRSELFIAYHYDAVQIIHRKDEYQW